MVHWTKNEEELAAKQQQMLDDSRRNVEHRARAVRPWLRLRDSYNNYDTNNNTTAVEIEVINMASTVVVTKPVMLDHKSLLH